MEELNLKLTEFENQGLYLNDRGFVHQNEYKPEEIRQQIDVIQAGMTDIPKLMRPRKTMNYSRGGSYGLKHVLEDYKCKTEGFYISNGQFIMAMALLGYNIKRDNPTSPNCCFNVCRIKQ